MAGTRTEDMDTIDAFMKGKLPADEFDKVVQQEEVIAQDTLVPGAPPKPENQEEAEKAEAQAKIDAKKAEAARVRAEREQARQDRENKREADRVERERQRRQEQLDKELVKESNRRVKEQAQLDESLRKESDRRVREQAQTEEKRRKGMEALQKQEAKLAEKQRHKATVEAARHGLPGPLGLVAEAAHGPIELAQNTASDVAADLEKVTTPGSILLPVLIVIVLFLAIIPVNGYPRLAWLWFVMTGNASLSGTPGGQAPASTIAPMPPPTPQQQEQASWDAHRQQVQHYQYTAIEEGDY